MGLIKAGLGALGGTLADQWKEFFYCEALDKDTLVVKGQKRVSGRSSNTKGSDNIISNGSGIAVADGQCMIIVEQGKVVEVCAEPGEFTYDTSTEPSIFTGKLGKGILDTFKTIGKRFTYGGDTGKDQRVYYFNTKEIMDNKFGTPNPIPFRVVDSKIYLDMDVSLRCSGIYSYTISDPLLFYTKVCGNIEQDFTREEIDNQLKTEFISALAPAFGKLSEMELRPNQLANHNEDICNAMNESLSKKWGELRGIKVVSVALNPITLSPEDAEMLKQAQYSARLQNPGLAGAELVGAQADAMRSAAANEGGAMNGFIGMGMAMNAGGGMNAQNFFNMQQQQNAQQAQAAAAAPAQDSWKCACGEVNTGKFCKECGAKKPEAQKGWTCACGEVNLGKFCSECGAKKPAYAPLYKCDKCGWEPEDPKNPPKFCPECGDIFDDNDIK
ncbi:MAG: SPFH domain-containing protein [Ruminococcus sp.]|nr:SPFH domain-containing protein [Ruminococcus sp.]